MRTVHTTLMAMAILGVGATAWCREAPVRGGRESREVVRARAEERTALQAAVRLLPRQPARIAVMDVTECRPGVRGHMLALDAFVVRGNGVIYIVQQSEVLRLARGGNRIFVAMLATILWHEMAHLDGADEQKARKAEEDLWTALLRDGVADPMVGLRYLQALKNRPDDQLLSLQ